MYLEIFRKKINETKTVLVILFINNDTVYPCTYDMQIFFFKIGSRKP